MHPSFLTIITSSLLWALIATVVVAIPGVPLAYVLARTDFPGKRLLSTFISLPLVLPPTAAGYLMLKLLADKGPLGRDTIGVDLGILFSPPAVVLACSVMAFPLFVRTARVSFEAVDPRFEQMGRSLGANQGLTFLSVTLPLALRGLTAAAILAFTRALGEFGATIIIAGNIPGRTQTLASAIYSAQQAGNDQLADFLVAIALALGFAAIFFTEWLTRPEPASTA